MRDEPPLRLILQLFFSICILTFLGTLHVTVSRNFACYCFYILCLFSFNAVSYEEVLTFVDDVVVDGGVVVVVAVTAVDGSDRDVLL